MDARSGYRNLKLNEKLSYLLTFPCQCGKCRNKRLLFRTAPGGNVLHRKIDKLFRELSKAVSIASKLLLVGSDHNGVDHDRTLYRVLQMHRKENLKPNKETGYIRCTSIPLFGEVIYRQGVRPDPRKLKVLKDMPPSELKKELQVFLGIMNYLRKLSIATAEVCNRYAD